MQHLWSLKLDRNLCFDATNHNSKFSGQATWLRCVQYIWGWDFHMYGRVYTFHSFLALVSTCNIPEASNLTTTFVSMLLIIILNFVVRWHGWGVFSTYICSDTRELPILCRQITKLWIINVDSKAKMVFNFGSLETVYVDVSFKTPKLSHYTYI